MANEICDLDFYSAAGKRNCLTSSILNENQKYKKEICCFYKTKKNKIRKIIREIYLRDDISCCILSCPSCISLNHTPTLSVVDDDENVIYNNIRQSEVKGRKIFILDETVLLNQFHFVFENDFFYNVVLLDIVMQIVRRKSVRHYTKILSLCDFTSTNNNMHKNGDLHSTCELDKTKIFKDQENEHLKNSNRRFAIFWNEFCRETYVERLEGESLDERNERGIFRACIWYYNHIQENFQTKPEILLITQDSGRKDRAIKQGITCLTIHELAELIKITFPNATEHLNLLADIKDDELGEAEENIAENFENSLIKTKIRKPFFPAHLSEDEINKGLKEKRYFKGTLKMKKGTCFRATVLCADLGTDIDVIGRIDLNRAIDGDVVAVEILLGKAENSKQAAIEKVFSQENNSKAEGIDADNLYEDLVDDIYKDDYDEKNQIKTFLEEDVENDINFQEFQTNFKKKGKIVGIIKKTCKEFCGTLRPEKFEENNSMSSSQFRIFIPFDIRIPNINIKTRNSKYLNNKRIVVVIDSWSRFSKYPSGHWISVIGDVGNPDVENAVILKQFNFSTREFSDAAISNFYNENWKVTDEMMKGRLDMRNKLTFSIDPPGCKDIDDALSIEVLANGNYLVGVHIADVTYFVKQGSSIDIEASTRCTTVYLVDRRTDMLPSILTSELCSLIQKKERLTFSVLWEMDERGEIKDQIKFTKSAIKSHAALTYKEAQNIIDNENDQSQLSSALRQLLKITKHLRKKRLDGGALELSSLEVKYKVSGDDVTEMSCYEHLDTNHLVEELMILANVSVGEFILSKFPFYAILRKHAPPKMDLLQNLKCLLEKSGLNYEFRFDNSKELLDSLNKIRQCDYVKDKIIRILTTRSMSQARYICSGNFIDRESYYHYGLACKIYTHFTSPIRRYADILVHRLLSAALYQNNEKENNDNSQPLYSPLSKEMCDKTLLLEKCDLMNEMTLNARWASSAAIKYYSYVFFKKHGCCFAEGIVIAVGRTFASVLLLKYGIEGIVFFQKDEFTYNNDKICITKNNDENFELKFLDKIVVQVSAEDKDFRFKTTMEFKSKLVGNEQFKEESLEFLQTVKNLDKKFSLDDKI